MCGLDLFAIGQIDCEGFRSRMLVDDIRTLHDKNGGSAHVGNGLIGCNRERIEVMWHGVTK
jgi:hypothetical protein